MLSKLTLILYKIAARIFGFEKRYISRVRGCKDWIYISYIPEVFYNLWNESYMHGHQSRQEMVRMVKVFNKIGYNVYVSNHYNYVLPDLNIKIVFGIEPGFIFACQKYLSAKKIYYATGAYWEHQNNMIKKRTDIFNSIHNTHYPYERLVESRSHLDYADYIVQIGTKFTIETYPKHYQSKIIPIHQSTTINPNIDIKIEFARENEFMWIGGGGSILKGLDLVFDYFIANPNKMVHIVGDVDSEILKIYDGRLGQNIKFHGFMNLNSEKFRQIVSRCNFLIYPSCSEGGCPGAVINAMYFGLIPIVSLWAAFDEIDALGFLLKKLSIPEITTVVRKIDSLDKSDILRRKKACYSYVRKTYSIERFCFEFEDVMRRLI